MYDVECIDKIWNVFRHLLYMTLCYNHLMWEVCLFKWWGVVCKEPSLCTYPHSPPRKYMYPAIYSKAKIRRKKWNDSWKMHFLLISFPWTPTLKCTKCISEQTLCWLSYISKVFSKWKIQFSVFNICEFDQLLFSGWIWTIFCVNHCLTWRHSDHKSPIFTNGPIQCWPPNCFRLFTFNMQDKKNTYCYKKKSWIPS